MTMGVRRGKPLVLHTQSSTCTKWQAVRVTSHGNVPESAAFLPPGPRGHPVARVKGPAEMRRVREAAFARHMCDRRLSSLRLAQQLASTLEPRVLDERMR